MITSQSGFRQVRYRGYCGRRPAARRRVAAACLAGLLPLLPAAAAAQPGSLTVTSVSRTKATLELSGHTGNWWARLRHNQTATCTNDGISGTTASLTGLTPGTNYHVAAFPNSNCGPTSLGIASTTFDTPTQSAPEAATNLTVSGGDQSVALTWTAGDNGGSAITGWEYLKEEGGTWETNWAAVPNSGASTTSHTVTGLTNGTAYKFKVRAVNANGDGAESAESAEVTPSTTPAAPGKPTVSPGEQQVALTWTAGDNGGSAITGWKYLKEEEGTWETNWTAVPNSGASTTAYTVTGLTGGTAYRFKVRAVNANGDGAESPESDVVTPPSVAPVVTANAPPAPDQPAAEAGDEQVTLTWTSNGDGGSPITAWQVIMKAEGGFFPGTWTNMPGSGPDTTTHTVTGLTNGTAYQFRVRAVNGEGEGASSPSSAPVTPAATPPAPGGPPTRTGGPAAEAGDGQVTLTWTSNGDGGSPITAWQIVKKAGAAAWETTWTDVPGSGPDTTTHTVTGLTNGTAYQFKVRAVNAFGEGAESPPSAPVTPAEPPADRVRLTVPQDGITETTATLIIENHAGAWWYANQLDAACAAVATGTTTVDLTGLTPGTEYVYTAYGDAACSDALASATFTTLVPVPAIPGFGAAVLAALLALAAARRRAAAR